MSAAACAVRDLHWLRSHAQTFDVRITDVTEAYAVFGLMGPNARAHLAGLIPVPLDSTAFPFGTAQSLRIAGVSVLALRITYVGELGWELYVPSAGAATVFDALSAAQITLAGYHAMDSLRIEKAYRHWGHDITDEDTPLEAGLGFTVAWDKAGGFIGRDALAAQRAAGLSRRLLLFKLSDPAVFLTHDEPIWRDGECVGHLASGAYSYEFGTSLGFGYVTLDDQGGCKGRYEIEVADRRVAATAHRRALYDPANERIRS